MMNVTNNHDIAKKKREKRVDEHLEETDNINVRNGGE